MSFALRRLLLAVSLLAAAVMAQASSGFVALENLSPAEQVRQLSLMLLVADTAEGELADAVDAFASTGVPVADGFDPDHYTTPLARIVDQESLLGGADWLFHFVVNHGAELRQRLQLLQAQQSLAGQEREHQRELVEDSIIIRTAIADAVDWVGLDEQPAVAKALEAYRARTFYQRNSMEYEQFALELHRLTAAAIDSVGGQSEAYERMFEDETRNRAIDEQIGLAEAAYRKEKFDPEAGKLTEKMIRQMVDAEGQPTP